MTIVERLYTEIPSYMFRIEGSGTSKTETVLKEIIPAMSAATLSGNDYVHSFETKFELVIAIDFGTDSTSVAHCYLGRSSHHSWDVDKISKRITAIQRWPNNNSTARIPTAISYDANGAVQGWGASAKPGKTAEYFKLGLQRSGGPRKLEGIPVSAAGTLSEFLTDPDGKYTDLAHKSPLDFAADYLSSVHEYLVQKYLPNQYGIASFKQVQLGYVITAPAIWTEKAKYLTRQAAIRAGINDSSLVFTTEPEAAVLSCHKDISVCFEDGDRFVVCDVGAGTVVR